MSKWIINIILGVLIWIIDITNWPILGIMFFSYIAYVNMVSYWTMFRG